MYAPELKANSDEMKVRSNDLDPPAGDRPVQDIDWETIRFEEAYRSARWSAWNSAGTAIVGLSTIRYLGCVSVMLLVASLMFGLIALCAVKRFGPLPLLPFALLGLTISGSFFAYWTYVAISIAWIRPTLG